VPDCIFGTTALNQYHSQKHTMNKDQAKGRLKEAEGKVQANYGDLKEDLKDASKGK
jgi:hypothetical protein